MIKIAIVDDHPLVINGISGMLIPEEGITISATYLNGKTLFEGLKKEQPDVLLLDIQLPGMGGDEIAAEIKKTYPAINILVLTNFDNSLYVNSLLQNGALGYLLKNTDKDTLVSAIKAVAQGQTFIEEKMGEKAEAFKKQLNRKTASKYALTPREKDILKLITQGHSNRDIAKNLFLSTRTVENYRFNLSIKLEAKNTAELIRKAIDLGIYD